jgi:hypothetical protein
VREVAVAVVWGKRVKGPRLGGIIPVRCGIAVLTLGDADQLRFAVAGQVKEGRGLVVGLGEDFMAHPMNVRSFWIFKPGCVLAGKADHEDIVPAVTIEVVGPDEKIVRVFVFLPQCTFESRNGHAGHGTDLQLKRCLGGVKLVALLEIGSFPPPGTGDQIILAVVVEVAEVRAFRPELIAELDSFEGMQFFAGNADRPGRLEGDEEKDVSGKIDVHGRKVVTGRRGDAS